MRRPLLLLDRLSAHSRQTLENSAKAAGTLVLRNFSLSKDSLAMWRRSADMEAVGSESSHSGKMPGISK
jgi:hypothetical protein